MATRRCEGCNGQEGCDWCEGCNGQEGCDWCEGCNWQEGCDWCEGCNGQEGCDWCEGCNGQEGCDCWEGCNGQEGCDWCEGCNWQEGCDWCEGCNGQEGCDCWEGCNWQEGCDWCEGCNGQEGCDWCEGCNGQEGCDWCEGCDCWEGCDWCEGCNCWEGCDWCEGCDWWEGCSRCPLISGTTKGTCSSILQYEELSTTCQPFSTNSGIQVFETAPPAEKRAMPGSVFSACSRVVTGIALPRNNTVLPAERSEAAGMSCFTGKFLSSSRRTMVLPTSPVAPATSTGTAILAVCSEAVARPAIMRALLVVSKEFICIGRYR